MKKRLALWFALFLLVGALWLMRPPLWPAMETPPLPQHRDTRSCQITRDKWDIPHIQAASDEAGFYCWGYTQATDRAWQMDYLRRLVQGRMAELYGMGHVKQDFFFRLLNFTAVADRWIERLPKASPSTERLLKFFVWGINDAFQKINSGVASRQLYASPRGHRLAPWSLRDTMLVLLLQSFYQTNKTFLDDLTHARLRVMLGEKRYGEIYGNKKRRLFDLPIIKKGEHPLVPAPKSAAPSTRPAAPTAPSTQPALLSPSSKPTLLPPSTKPALLPPSSRPATQPPAARPSSQPTPTQILPSLRLPSRSPSRHPSQQGAKDAPAQKDDAIGSSESLSLSHLLKQGDAASREQLLRALAALAEVLPSFQGQGEGSNSWVVAPKRSASGHAMLANDPHLNITIPSFWHEVHLNTPTINVLGLSVPGASFIVSGHNERVAWGITNGYTNVADLMAVKLDLDGGFRVGKEKHQARSIRPVVRVAVGPVYLPIFWQRFRTTKLGPILPIQWGDGRVLLLRWSGFHIEDAPYIGLIEMLRVKDAREYDRVVQKNKVPCFNLVFADTQGQIGYRQTGLLPRRLAGQRGLLDTNNPQEHWQGFLQPHEVPALFQPARGYIVTANNHTFPENYPFYTGHIFVQGFRARRIEQMLEAQPKHTLESFKQIQTDVRVPAADDLLPLMLNRIHQAPALVQPEPLYNEAIQILQRWDRRATREQYAPTIFRAWMTRFERAAFEREKIVPDDDATLRVLRDEIKPGSDKAVPILLSETLLAAVKHLRKNLGPDPAQWLWGKYHRLAFRHLLAEAPKSWMLPPAPMHGDDETVSPALSSGTGPFLTRAAASYRLVVEMSPKRIRSWGVLAGRQIDRDPSTLSTQQKLWLNHQYRPRPFYPDEVKAHQKSTSTIRY